MNIYRYPQRNEWDSILQRPVFETQSLDAKVQQIIERVKSNGDAAVQEFTQQFDGVTIQQLMVSEDEFAQATKIIDASLKAAIEIAAQNIANFHKVQIPQPVSFETMPGVKCWQKPIPIEKVGLYVPGGTAPLFSTVLMLAIPARLAGCDEMVLCSPPAKDGSLHPAILYAAQIAGVKKVFKVGGVQAIAAMAWGTDSIPAVDKIFGPGNQYVTAAKQVLARSKVAIDMPAGPSEVMVLGDENSNAAFIASDLLSQAEHGKDSQVVFVTTSEFKAGEVKDEVFKQADELSRKELAAESLKSSAIVIVSSKDEMMEMVNVYAPEHLIISTSDALELCEKVKHAGSVFVGELTPESAGDYASGTNHTLPTQGWARAYSGVNMDSYFKKTTFQQIFPEGVKVLGPVVEKMAEAELLTAHKNAMTLRLKSLQ